MFSSSPQDTGAHFVSLAATAVMSMTLGVVSTIYILKRDNNSSLSDNDNVQEQKNDESNSNDVNNNENDDTITPLTEMRYNPVGSQHRKSSTSEGQESRTPCLRRNSSSNITDGHVSAISGGSFSDWDVESTREESYISETEIQFKGEDEFGETILQSVKSLPESLRLLRRTRAISALASRLIEARDEEECFYEVSRLLALMFDLDRISFGMVTDSNHFLLKRMKVTRCIENGDISPSSFELELMDSDFQRPLDGTACGVACKTLKEHYAPRTKDSSFDTHQALYKIGYKSTLTVPILVNGKKCAGAILAPRREEDGFSKQSRVLISDIACIFGSNLYSKRLRKATEESNRLSRQILNSFVPAKVLEKIEWYWNESKSSRRRISEKSLTSLDNTDDNDQKTTSTVWYVSNTDWSEAPERQVSAGSVNNGIQSKIQLLRNMNRDEDDSSEDDVGVITQRAGNGIDLAPTRALYAENARNVCIVFTDIVGFSRISMEIEPIKVMDMLQNLFNRFDELCDLHGVMKLETIGDAYICATNLLEEDNGEDVNERAEKAAIRALAIAKDMVCEARNVSIPSPMTIDGTQTWAGQSSTDFETLEIRVGVHCGDVTCGVLGQKMPKFMACGKAVNMAARMEQTSLPSTIRTTREFHDLVGSAETNWSKKEVIQLKNMGEVETYLLHPLSTS